MSNYDYELSNIAQQLKYREPPIRLNEKSNMIEISCYQEAPDGLEEAIMKQFPQIKSVAFHLVWPYNDGFPYFRVYCKEF